MSPDRTLVVIRERSFLDLLDLATIVVRRRPLVLAAWLALGTLPCVAFNAWVLGLMSDSNEEFPRFIPLFLLLAIEAPWATAPLTVAMGGLMFGNRPSAGRMVRTLFVSSGRMFLYQGLARGALLLIWMIGAFFAGKFRFLNEVILLEQGKWSAVSSRCWDLTRDRGALMFFRWGFQLATCGLFVLAFAYAGSNLEELMVEQQTPELGVASAGRVFEDLSLTSWHVHVSTWLGIGFFTVVRFLEYIDQRTRLEGWEIELRMRALGGALEDEERW